METKHFQLYLDDRPSDAVESISDSIKEKVERELESITDPESLLQVRKELRSKKEALQAEMKRTKTAISRSNKQREEMLKSWEQFREGILQLAKKYKIDFERMPDTVAGRSFISKLQNMQQPEPFISVAGKRIPQKRTDSLLDDSRIQLFEVQVKSELLEEIIARKATAMKELFSSDPE